MVHACTPSVQEMEAGHSEVQASPLPQSELRPAGLLKCRLKEVATYEMLQLRDYAITASSHSDYVRVCITEVQTHRGPHWTMASAQEQVTFTLLSSLCAAVIWSWLVYNVILVTIVISASVP